MNLKGLTLALVLGVLGTVVFGGGAVEVDPALQPYQPIDGVSGSVKSVGSDTMNNLMTLWAEDFKKHYPTVQVEIEGKGSSTAPPALVDGVWYWRTDRELIAIQ